MSDSLLKTNIAAFQANTGNLWKARGEKNPVGFDCQLGMMAGTSPSMIFTKEFGPIIAFQANTGNLFVFNARDGATDTQLPMMKESSPYITAEIEGGDIVVAYQSARGSLCLYKGVPGQKVDLNLGMFPGTSATSFDGNFYFFQGNTGTLWQCGSAPNTGVDSGLGMMAGTSPSASFTGQFNNDYIYVAFHANTGALWTVASFPSFQQFNAVSDLGLAMAPGTSPSSSVTHTAYQGDNGSLWLANNQKPSDSVDLKLGMLAGTSPCCIVDGADDVYIAFQANTGNLWISKSKPNSGMDTGLGMMAGTSPALQFDIATKVPF